MEGDRPKRIAILLVLLVFLLGSAAGGLGTYVWRARVQASAAPRRSSTPHQTPTVAHNPVFKGMTLTADQTAKIDAVLTQMSAQYKGIHEQFSGQMDAARKQGRDQIRAILTPDQAAQFDETLRKMDEERKKRMSGNGSGNGN